MAAALAAPIADFVLGLALGPVGQDSGNRVSFEGLALGSRNAGELEIGIRSLEAVALRVASGPLVLEVGKLALRELRGVVRMEAGRPQLVALEAASVELSGVKFHGPLLIPASVAGPAGHAAATAWCLGPLAGANGSIRAEIVDAQLLFDADVTVPIRQGAIDFNSTTVEHVGPDSRMGVSRLGIYVDAPTGRSYLYQFPSTPVAGVEYEQRGALLGARVTNRGHLLLQPFGEGLLGQPWVGRIQGLTEQARQLFDRSAVSGEVRLGDGKFCAPGVQAELVERADGRNEVRLHSEAVGRGLTAEMASLSARNALLGSGQVQMGCAEIVGSLVLQFSVEGTQLRFACDVANMKLSGLRLRPQGDQGR